MQLAVGRALDEGGGLQPDPALGVALLRMLSARYALLASANYDDDVVNLSHFLLLRSIDDPTVARVAAKSLPQAAAAAAPAVLTARAALPPAPDGQEATYRGVRGGDASSPSGSELLHEDLEASRDRHADDRADEPEERSGTRERWRAR